MMADSSLQFSNGFMVQTLGVKPVIKEQFGCYCLSPSLIYSTTFAFRKVYRVYYFPEILSTMELQSIWDLQLSFKRKLKIPLKTLVIECTYHD